MTLKEWFLTKPRGAKAAMAEALGISRTWMALVIAGRRKPSPERAIIISRMTNGEVTKADLRPDLFGEE